MKQSLLMMKTTAATKMTVMTKMEPSNKTGNRKFCAQDVLEIWLVRVTLVGSTPPDQLCILVEHSSRVSIHVIHVDDSCFIYYQL
jgi:pyrimidine deaminase RibD-like protein